jgi:hypothetical protein
MQMQGALLRSGTRLQKPKRRPSHQQSNRNSEMGAPPGGAPWTGAQVISTVQMEVANANPADVNPRCIQHGSLHINNTPINKSSAPSAQSQPPLPLGNIADIRDAEVMVVVVDVLNRLFDVQNPASIRSAKCCSNGPSVADGHHSKCVRRFQSPLICCAPGDPFQDVAALDLAIHLVQCYLPLALAHGGKFLLVLALDGPAVTAKHSYGYKHRRDLKDKR